MTSWYEQRIFNPLMDRALRRPRVEALRRALLSGARGEVLEIGIGTGLNLPHYPAHVRRLRIVQREEQFDSRVAPRAGGRELELVRGDAQALPLESASVDTLVCTFVLCSVDDPLRALAEFARVLRPDGLLLLAEHVRSPRAFERALQRALTPVHRHWACGCRLDRDLSTCLATAGFSLPEPVSAAQEVLPFPASELLSGTCRREVRAAAASPRRE